MVFKANLEDVFRVAHKGATGVTADFDAIAFSANTWNNQANRAITVTDILPNTNFHVQSPTAVNAQYADRAGAQITQTSAMRGDIANTRQAYLAADQGIKAEIAVAMGDAVGAALAGQIMSDLVPAAGSDTATAAGAVADAAVGNAGTIMNAVYELGQHMNGPKADEIRAAVDAALAKLQEASQPLHMRPESARVNIPKPVGNYANVNADQLIAFLARDVNQDPVMRGLRDAEIALNEFEDNNAVLVGHGDQKMTADKLAAAMERGQDVTELVDSREDAQGILFNIDMASDTIACYADTLRGADYNNLPVSANARGLMGADAQLRTASSPSENQEFDVAGYNAQFKAPGLTIQI